MFFESFMYPASLTFRNHCHPAPLVTNASLPSLWSQCCAEAALLQRLLRTSSHFERFGNPVQQRYWSRVKEFVGYICQSLMNILRCPATQPHSHWRQHEQLRGSVSSFLKKLVGKGYSSASLSHCLHILFILWHLSFCQNRGKQLWSYQTLPHWIICQRRAH